MMRVCIAGMISRVAETAIFGNLEQNKTDPLALHLITTLIQSQCYENLLSGSVRRKSG